ncbi:putative Fe-S oxidoreductase [Minicystis rosea]|nr:putative Fe-S oxidoreductase [Minicystis rosea]
MSDLDPSARGILDAGRDGDDPTPDDRARIRASLMRAIAAGSAAAIAGETGAAAAAPAAAPLALGWKLAAAVTAVLLASSGLYFTREHHTAPAVITTASASAAPPAPIPEPSASAADPIAPPVVTAPSAVVIAPRSSVEHSPSFPRPVATASPTAPASSIAMPPIVAIAAPDAPPPPATAAPEAPRPPPDSLAAETQSLREAHGVLQGGDASRALALLDEKAAAGAKLREERGALRVLALCQLGKVEEARAAAQRFFLENPQSPLAARVRASCIGP